MHRPTIPVMVPPSPVPPKMPDFLLVRFEFGLTTTGLHLLCDFMQVSHNSF